MTIQTRVLSERYRMGELIGRGGMASVYRGRDLTLGRDVAIKVLNPNLARDSVFRTRFRLEAQAASRMSHPAIVRVFDAGEDTGPDEALTPYIVMELVQGRLLKDVIAAGTVSVSDALRYTDGILEALVYSHRAGVVHRDIKPANVMITDDDQVKVMDFGIARAVSDSSATIAETTQILGTAAYFSPEQAKGEPVDARADLYSAGVVLYELLTGKQPFRGATPVAVAYQHVSEAPVPPSQVRDDVPRTWDAVVLRALAKDPFQRFQDADSFRQALKQTTSGAVPSQRQVGALSHQLYGPDPRQAAETARSLRQLSNDTAMKRTQAGPPVAWIWAGVVILAVLLVAVLFWVTQIRPGAVTPAGARLVPDVSGMTFERAVNALEDNDLTVTRVDQPSADVPKDVVLKTDPVSGASVTEGHKVTVYVSQGEELATVPANLVGMTRADAKSALEALGLKLGTVTSQNDPELAQNTVISADPDPGDEVVLGTTVTLVVASGHITIRDYTATYTVSSAQAELEAMGLTVETAPDPNCPAKDPIIVTQQSLLPGDQPIKSAITLNYCSGPAS